MKNTFKKSIVCLMLIFISLVFVGCSSVNYINYTDENGVYTEVVEIAIDETKFENISQAKHDISDAVNNELLAKYTQYTHDINMKLHELKDNEEKKDLFNTYTDLLDDITWTVDNFDNSNYFYIKLKFESKTSYLFFYDLKEKNFSNKEVKKGLFVNKIYFKGNLGYYIQNGLYSTLKNSPYLAKYFKNFNEEDVNLTYSYLAGSTRYKSNADKVFYVGDGLYSHTWNVDLNNLDKEIYFSVTLANRWIWYLTAIVISLITLIILLGIGLIKHLKNKRKTEKNPMES